MRKQPISINRRFIRLAVAFQQRLSANRPSDTCILSKNRRQYAQINGTGQVKKRLQRSIASNQFHDLGFSWSNLLKIPFFALYSRSNLPRNVDLRVF